MKKLVLLLVACLAIVSLASCESESSTTVPKELNVPAIYHGEYSMAFESTPDVEVGSIKISQNDIVYTIATLSPVSVAKQYREMGTREGIGDTSYSVDIVSTGVEICYILYTHENNLYFESRDGVTRQNSVYILTAK